MSKKTIKPWPMNDAGVAFGQTGPKDLPSLQECNKLYDENEIPAKYVTLVGDWFFGGLEELKVTPREGINEQEAMMCIKGEIGSWGRKHEHKELLVAWLFDQWFEDVKWKAKKFTVK